MKTFARALLSLVVFVAVHLFVYWIPLSLISSGAHDISFLPEVVSLASGLGAAWFVWTKSRTARDSLFTFAAYSAAVVGSISFCVGFFGPMLLKPDSNLGPLLGLLVTGPLGALVGAVAGGMLWTRRRTSAPSR